MKQKQLRTLEHSWRKKPGFGSLYTMESSKYIYISMYYFKQRLRFPTDKEDTPKNWDEMSDFLEKVGQKIKNRTFVFAKAFYWLDEATKAHFTALEGNGYKPEPTHVEFGDYAETWMELNVKSFASITKRRYFNGAFYSRILPYFKTMMFANITGSVISSFIDNLKRSNGSEKPLSAKRIKSIIGPLSTIWKAACNDYNWNIKNPFSDISSKFKQLEDKAAQEKERLEILRDDTDEEIASTRDVLLLSEWQSLINAVDPHYHAAMELLLMGMIGSELEGLQKRHIKDDAIHVRCSVVRDTGGLIYLKFKPKNWYRKRNIPLTRKLKELIGRANASSTSTKSVQFDNDIELPENAFVLTMKDGKFFNYEIFKKTIWDKAVKDIGMDRRVPYASRHTFVQWSLLIGMSKSRLVDLMGHSTKQMVDEVYGKYRPGLVDERERILDYLGEDFLAEEELRIFFPERYQRRIAKAVTTPGMLKAPDLTATFSQSFSQSQGLYADNYL
jgi:integrase